MPKSWLGKKGFEASTASSVSRAKKAIETECPDIILSDLRLPDEDGTQLLAWINENNYNIPFIMMTSYAEIQTAVQAMKLGANDYISKPVNPDELLKKINEALATAVRNIPQSTPTPDSSTKSATTTTSNPSTY